MTANDLSSRDRRKLLTLLVTLSAAAAVGAFGALGVTGHFDEPTVPDTAETNSFTTPVEGDNWECVVIRYDTGELHTDCEPQP